MAQPDFSRSQPIESDNVIKLTMIDHDVSAGMSSSRELIWNDDDPPAVNYDKLGARLSASGDLFRRPQYGDGLLMLLPAGRTTNIEKGEDLAPVVVDRVPVRILKAGKSKGGQITAAHLKAMLKCEVFLQHFRFVDRVVGTPMYLPDFTITRRGYNDGGDGNRILYVGGEPEFSDSLRLVDLFLDTMAFASNADRTNAVAGLVTVLLRNHWPGGKPNILATATKSQAGKDTVISFTTGLAEQCSISYQRTNWALERSFVGALKHNPDTGVVVVENARLDRGDRFIASAFIERFVTDPEPLLFSTGTGQPVRRANDIVVAISTNFGSVSEDILNRALPIHLNPTGNLSDRQSVIGNPKHEFLPENREGIAAEARGMIERWKEAGQPQDDNVGHSFSPWARTVGGVLKVSGFTDFLANYEHRKTADDPVREGLAILGAAASDEWHRPEHWANEVAKLGLTKRLIPRGDHDSDAGRRRGIGVVLSAHRDETFVAQLEDEQVVLRLERKRLRAGTPNAQVHYRFAVVERHSIECEATEKSRGSLAGRIISDPAEED